MRPFWLLGTGTGRCGTGYFARVLSSVGVQCSHEGVFGPDSHEQTMERIATRIDPANTWWGWEAESSWLAAPYLGLPELEGVTVVHLVRHPKKVIDSQMRIRAFEGKHPRFHEWQMRHLPELEGLPPLHQAALFYVRWNQMIEPHADIRWQIEGGILRLLDMLDIDWHDKEIYQDRRHNSRAGWGQSDVDLDGLPEPLRSDLQEITTRYGYQWPVPRGDRDRALRN